MVWRGCERQDHSRFVQKDGIADNTVFSLLLDRSGTLWIGTRGGLTSYDGQRFRSYTTADGLANNYVLCLYRGQRRGTLWIGTGGGGLSAMRRRADHVIHDARWPVE